MQLNYRPTLKILKEKKLDLSTLRVRSDGFNPFALKVIEHLAIAGFGATFVETNSCFRFAECLW